MKGSRPIYACRDSSLKDIETQTKCREAHTEATLLHMFRGWSHDMRMNFKDEGDVEGQRFQKGLGKIVHLDSLEANAEYGRLLILVHLQITACWGHWGHRRLDQDRGTKEIERQLEAYKDIFDDMLEEDAAKMTSKYGHLAPADYFAKLPQVRLDAWESRWLSGKNPRTALVGLHEKILEGEDVFYKHNNENLTINRANRPLLLSRGNS